MDEILQRPCAHQIIVTHGGSPTFVVASWIRTSIEPAGYAGLRAASGSVITPREDDFFHNRQVVDLGDARHLDPAKTGRPRHRIRDLGRAPVVGQQWIVPGAARRVSGGDGTTHTETVEAWS
ncbi:MULTISPECIES: hypothetical protein [unclassified Streptomyces]|uniref:hypothetical protein n=1 Tax=unclassified Streptomyces TaxID=2593676 RepID=UPI0037155B71